MNEAYNQHVVERTAEAANEALRSMRPARMRAASLSTPELDRFIADSRPPVKHDSALLVLAAVGMDGKPIGTLVTWANHPESLGSKNREISADYLAYFHPMLEGKLGGVSVFCNGAASEFAEKVHSLSGQPESQYRPRRAAYYIKKFRAKGMIRKKASEQGCATSSASSEWLPEDRQFLSFICTGKRLDMSVLSGKSSTGRTMRENIRRQSKQSTRRRHTALAHEETV